MARHRWATGEHSPGSDRLDRVLNLNRAGSRPAELEAVHGDGFDDEYSADSINSELPVTDSTVARQPRPSGRRWAATRRAALLAAGCALAVGGWQFVTTDRTPGEVVPIGSPAPSSVASAPGEAAAAEGTAPVDQESAAELPVQQAQGAQTTTVVIHVAGAVQAPGVVEIAAGSRVFEVLEKAGGALPEAELAAVNLAAVVQDGQQILIPRVGEPLPADAAPAPDAATAGALLNLNTADATDLEELPRVGPVLAERIVEWRTQHGPFTRPEDLDAVPGIGPAMLESLLPLVTV